MKVQRVVPNDGFKVGARHLTVWKCKTIKYIRDHDTYMKIRKWLECRQRTVSGEFHFGLNRFRRANFTCLNMNFAYTTHVTHDQPQPMFLKNYSVIQKFFYNLLTWHNLYNYSQNSKHPMQYIQFLAKSDTRFQTIWIEDQAQRFVGSDLDPYGLNFVIVEQRISRNCRKIFSFCSRTFRGHCI